MKKSVIALGLAAASLGSGQALAVENWVPYLDGSALGAATGALPPPGFYFQNLFVAGQIAGHDAGGHYNNSDITAFLNVSALIWVPNFQVLGGQYAAALIQPQDHIELNGVTSRSGFFETIVSPVNISWKLQNDLHLAVGLGIYIPDGTFDPNVKGGTLPSANYWAFEPSLAISWLHNGWNASAKFVIDTAGKDHTTGYTNGAVFDTDFSLTKTVGKWTFGGGGYWRNQFTDDSSTDAATQANIIAAHGNRAEEFGLGAVAGYNFGPVIVDVYYEKALEWKNEAAGDRIFTRTTIPLGGGGGQESLK
jgi:hypothetical protein